MTSIDRLSPREREVLALIAEGLKLSEIAARLHRSVKTIENHRYKMGRKLGVSNRVLLARVWWDYELEMCDGNEDVMGGTEGEDERCG